MWLAMANGARRGEPCALADKGDFGAPTNPMTDATLSGAVIDLAISLVGNDQTEEEGCHVRRAGLLADDIGSARQRRRIQSLSASAAIDA